MIYKKQTSKTVEKAVIDLKEKLSEIGFGVLWEINFKDKFKEKGLDYDGDYMILEVCNPLKAHMVLKANTDMGLFLPCKIAVFEDKGMVFIGMPEPTKMMHLTDQPSVEAMAHDVETLLKSAIEKTL